MRVGHPPPRRLILDQAAIRPANALTCLKTSVERALRHQVRASGCRSGPPWRTPRCPAALVDAPDRRVGREVALVAPGVVHLRHQAHVGEAWRIAHAERPGRAGEHRLDRAKAFRHPVPIPGQRCGSPRPSSRSRYCSTRRLLSGWISHAIATPIARDVARPDASLGSSAGSGSAPRDSSGSAATA